MIKGINTIIIYKEQILKYYTQEELFIIAGFTVKEGFVKNPYRNDKSPGCKFYYLDDVLLFSDFTNFFDKISITCFEALDYKFNVIDKKNISINDICLDFIKKHKKYRVKLNKLLKDSSSKTESISRNSRKNCNYEIDLKIVYEELKNDKHNYFYKYNLPSDFLKKERVFRVLEYYINSFYDRALKFNRYHNPKLLYTIAYMLKEDRIKLYMPNAVKNQSIKFLGNTTCADVYNIDNLDTTKPLLISKGIKDALVIKYHYYENVVALNAETCIKLSNEIVEYFKQFPEVYVLYDNDEVGIKMSKYLCKEYNYKFINPKLLFKDIADNYLKPDLKENIIKTLSPYFKLKNELH
jgi:hypothetical protein